MILTGNVRVKVEVGDEVVTFVVRRPTAAEQSSFLSKRFVQGDNGLKNNAQAVRVELVDKILVDVHGLEYENAEGAVVPLNASSTFSEADRRLLEAQTGIAVRDYRDLIPMNLKCSVATYFEERVGKAGN